MNPTKHKRMEEMFARIDAAKCAAPYMKCNTCYHLMTECRCAVSVRRPQSGWTPAPTPAEVRSLTYARRVDPPPKRDYAKLSEAARRKPVAHWDDGKPKEKALPWVKHDGPLFPKLAVQPRGTYQFKEGSAPQLPLWCVDYDGGYAVRVTKDGVEVPQAEWPDGIKAHAKPQPPSPPPALGANRAWYNTGYISDKWRMVEINGECFGRGSDGAWMTALGHPFYPRYYAEAKRGEGQHTELPPAEVALLVAECRKALNLAGAEEKTDTWPKWTGTHTYTVRMDSAREGDGRCYGPNGEVSRPIVSWWTDPVIPQSEALAWLRANGHAEEAKRLEGE